MNDSERKMKNGNQDVADISAAGQAEEEIIRNMDEPITSSESLDVLFGDFPDSFFRSASAYVTACEMKQSIGERLKERAINNLIAIAVSAVKRDQTGKLTYRSVFSEIKKEYLADAGKCRMFIKNTEKYINELNDSTEAGHEDIMEWKEHLASLKANQICLELYIEAAGKLIDDQDRPGKSRYAEEFEFPISDFMMVKAYPSDAEITG